MRYRRREGGGEIEEESHGNAGNLSEMQIGDELHALPCGIRLYLQPYSEGERGLQKANVELTWSMSLLFLFASLARLYHKPLIMASQRFMQRHICIHFVKGALKKRILKKAILKIEALKRGHQ